MFQEIMCLDISIWKFDFQSLDSGNQENHNQSWRYGMACDSLFYDSNNRRHPAW